MKFSKNTFCLSFLLILFSQHRGSDAFSLSLTLPHVVSEADEHLMVILELLTPAAECKFSSSEPDQIRIEADGVISANAETRELAEMAKFLDLNLRRQFMLPIVNDLVPEEDKYVTITAECSYINFKRSVSKRVLLKDDDKQHYTSPLTLETCISNVFYRDSPQSIQVKGFTGVGTCSVKTSKPGFFDINPKRFNLKPGSEQILFYKFKKAANNVFKNVNFIFHCEENKSGRKIRFVEKTIAISRDMTKDDKFAPIVCSPLVLCKGDEINLAIKTEKGEGNCVVSLPNGNKKVEITSEKKHEILPEVMRYVTIKFNKGELNGQDQMIQAIVKCKNEKGFSTTSKKAIILREEEDCFGEGDPHFQQKVFNHASNAYSSLCYDVTGEPGDSIFILREKYPTDVSIYGILKDDYYMHQIKIVIESETIIVGINRITFSNSTYLKWNATEKVQNVTTTKYKLEISNDQIEIYSNFKKFTKIVIEKMYRFPAGFHLNVHFNGLNEDFKGLDGLLGKIGNNHFKFFLPVQETQSRGAAMVNGKYFIADLSSRNTNKCWYMNVKSALYPNLLSDYVLKMI